MAILSDILNAVAGLQMTVAAPGLWQVQMAYAGLQQDPSSAECPFFVNWARRGEADFAAVQVSHVTTYIDMNLCVARAESGATLLEVQQLAHQYRDPVFQTFAAHIALGGTIPSILTAIITNWDVRKIPLGSTEFIGLLFVLKVEEMEFLTIGL